MEKWEYKNVHAPTWTEQEKILNQLGEEGWELVAVVNTSYFYFKRPKL